MHFSSQFKGEVPQGMEGEVAGSQLSLCVCSQEADRWWNFFCSLSWGPQPMEAVHLAEGASHLSESDPDDPQRCAQRLVSQVFLDPVQLSKSTIKKPYW